MFWSYEAQVCGKARLCFRSLLLIRATGPRPGLPLGRLNEMRDGHYGLWGFFSTNMHKRWLNGVWMHECAHGDLCERMHELMSHCDEKLNDPSATQYIFIVQMCGWRTVTQQYLTSESRRHSTLLIQTTVMVHTLRGRYVAAVWEVDDLKHVRESRLHIGLHFILNFWLWAAFYNQLQVNCNIIFLHVCLPTQCGWEEWCEKDGLASKVWGGWRVTVPLGLIVEARQHGARAGKVSTQQGQQKRKYRSCMEGRYLTPHSILCSVKREEPHWQKKRNGNGIEFGDVGDGGEAHTWRWDL